PARSSGRSRLAPNGSFASRTTIAGTSSDRARSIVSSSGTGAAPSAGHVFPTRRGGVEGGYSKAVTTAFRVTGVADVVPTARPRSWGPPRGTSGGRESIPMYSVLVKGLGSTTERIEVL